MKRWVSGSGGVSVSAGGGSTAGVSGWASSSDDMVAEEDSLIKSLESVISLIFFIHMSVVK